MRVRALLALVLSTAALAQSPGEPIRLFYEAPVGCPDDAAFRELLATPEVWHLLKGAGFDLAERAEP